MISSSIGAIVYQRTVEESDGNQVCRLRFASCLARDQGVTPFRSEDWVCRLPDPAKLVRRAFGYSETRGIVGGVDDPILAAQSETIERLLGDALTVCLAQLLEVQPQLIFVLGPCYPKTLGRFLSLRLPSSTIIVWLTRLRQDGLDGLQQLPVSSIRKIVWDQDDLLNSFTYPDANPRWLVEFMDTGDRAEKAEMIRSLLDKTTTKSDPRELRFSAAILLPQGEKEFIVRGQTHVPEWLKTNVSTIVKPRPLAAKGPPTFEWLEAHSE